LPGEITESYYSIGELLEVFSIAINRCGLEPLQISWNNFLNHSFSNKKVDLELSARKFNVPKSTKGSNEMVKCGIWKLRVATTESLGIKEKGGHH
jgi:hypothetical protein